MCRFWPKVRIFPRLNCLNVRNRRPPNSALFNPSEYYLPHFFRCMLRKKVQSHKIIYGRPTLAIRPSTGSSLLQFCERVTEKCNGHKLDLCRMFQRELRFFLHPLKTPVTLTDVHHTSWILNCDIITLIKPQPQKELLDFFEIVPFNQSNCSDVLWLWFSGWLKSKKELTLPYSRRATLNAKAERKCSNLALGHKLA